MDKSPPRLTPRHHYPIGTLMQTKAKLLREIKAFLRLSKMEASTFGRLSVNNSRLVAKLERGGTVSIDVLDRVRTYMQTESKRLKRMPAKSRVVVKRITRAQTRGGVKRQPTIKFSRRGSAAVIPPRLPI